MNRRSFLNRAVALGAVAGLGLVRTSATSLPGADPASRGDRRRRVLLSCPTQDAEQFKRLAEYASSLSVTHIAVGDLPKARWQWVDAADPWPNWAMLQPSFFKIAPPEELAGWIPAEYARRCQQVLAERGEILRQFGLKGSFHGAEPMWLPEGFYAAHPDWRGPRCQYPPRARRSYYAPCIDKPEVLSMYRNAVAEICKLVPIEEFLFLTNDSGSGICWHPGLYPGVNGPEFCKGRTMAERLDGWMREVQAGAREAGCDAEVTIAGRALASDGKPRARSSVGPDSYLYSSQFYPVLDLAQPCAFAEQLQEALSNPDRDYEINIDSLRSTSLLELGSALTRDAAQGPEARYRKLGEVANRMAGGQAGPHLLRTWECIGRAAEILAPINEGGPVLLLGSINQRWLVRPLVPFPLELTVEEKNYYRPFQMQAWTEEIAADLMSLQGNYLIRGPASAWLGSRIFAAASSNLRLALAEINQALAVADQDRRPGLLHLQLCAHALQLTIRNADLTVQYQEFLDRQRETPHDRPDPKWGRPEPENGMRIVEEDITNTRELIALLASTSDRLFATSNFAREEDVFLFHPDLIGHLKKKIEIAERHLPEHIRL